jgi:transitional endoplasmic reticulum ATPase
MPPENDALKSLREAVKLSPDNIPLRRHFADSLLAQGLLDEAEKEYRGILLLAPEDLGIKAGLADAAFRKGNLSTALVILEELSSLPDAPARANLLYAKILFERGDRSRAAHAYKKAVTADPSLADDDLDEELTERTVQRPVTLDADDERVLESLSYDETLSPAERPRITFEDVGGMDKVKEEIRMKIIYPLLHPDMYKAYGKKTGGGILMYGPPGCGKTHLARATAGEIKARFIAVGISEVLDMYIGESEKNLHELFESARNQTPCVLFFDEVDALGASRSDMRKSAGRQLINQFLQELDGVDSQNDGLLVLAATNAPWHIDPAFLRPGRFDRILFVPPPDEGARAAILQILMRDKPVEGVDYASAAKAAKDFSGADLKAVVDVAVEAKLREAMKTGAPKPLAQKDITTAAKTVRPSTKEWFATARNYALYSNQSGLYNDILEYLRIT